MVQGNPGGTGETSRMDSFNISETVQKAGDAYERAKEGIRAGEAREDSVTRSVEHYTAQVPSIGYLGAACCAMGLSALLHLSGRKHDALFFGQWVPSILLMGLYNKLVKVGGSDASTI